MNNQTSHLGAAPGQRTIFTLRMLRSALLLCLVYQAQVCLADDSEIAFFPTWKLLNAQEKQQFIAGYVQGWRDAEKVTKIAREYVHSNPEGAAEGLKKVEELYNLSGVAPEALLKAIDAFYDDPAHHNASLSRAVSAAKNVLK